MEFITKGIFITNQHIIDVVSLCGVKKINIWFHPFDDIQEAKVDFYCIIVYIFILW